MKITVESLSLMDTKKRTASGQTFQKNVPSCVSSALDLKVRTINLQKRLNFDNWKIKFSIVVVCLKNCSVFHFSREAAGRRMGHVNHSFSFFHVLKNFEIKILIVHYVAHLNLNFVL